MKCLGKRKFSRKGAWIALHRISVDREPGQHEISMYNCQLCTKWHLSKFPPATNLGSEWVRISAEGGRP